MPSNPVLPSQSHEARSLPPRLAAAKWTLLFDDDFSSYPFGMAITPLAEVVVGKKEESAEMLRKAGAKE